MKMKQIFPNPSNGIFNYINIENTGLSNKNYLNILYHTNNSEKIISPLLESFVTDNIFLRMLIVRSQSASLIPEESAGIA